MLPHIFPSIDSLTSIHPSWGDRQRTNGRFVLNVQPIVHPKAPVASQGYPALPTNLKPTEPATLELESHRELNSSGG
jgi:hypothetical protein